MEKVLKIIDSGKEKAIASALDAFNKKNNTTFHFGEAAAIRKKFCQALLHNLSTSLPNSWSLETKILGLIALRILAREREGTDQLISMEGLKLIVELAELSKEAKESCFASGEQIPEDKLQALIEAVKCLCNVVRTNQFLAPACADLGCLRGLALRLALCRTLELPHDVIFFDLRLLFLITACGPAERVKFRDDWNGLPILLNLIDTTLFGRETPPQAVTGVTEPDAEVAAVTGVPEPDAEVAAVTGVPEPDAEVAAVTGVTEPDAEVAAVTGVPEPDAEVAAVTGVPEPDAEVAAVTGVPEPDAEVAAVTGVPEPDAEVTGVSEPDAEVTGVLEPDAEVTGVSEPDAEVAAVTGVPEPDTRGASESTAGSEPVSRGDIPAAASVQGTLDSIEATPPPQSGNSEKKSENETDTIPPEAESPAQHSSEGPESNSGPSLAPLRDSIYCLSAPLRDQQLAMLSEALKIVFNQTVHWKEDSDYDDEELRLFTHLTHLLRVLLLSVPVSQSKAAAALVAHTIEVVLNIPQQCSSAMLLPPHVHVMPVLNRSFPEVYPLQSMAAAATVSMAAAKDVGSNKLYCEDLDQIFDEWNVAAIVVLLNFFHAKLYERFERHGLSPILSALRSLSRGHRSIRRFLKSKILPPLRQVTQRPDEGDTLKSRVVQLMTAGTHGAEEITAEFLFVLCKESAARLIKHTGYGNAAGLLLSRGLLTGGRSEGEAEYSSDSETSDTEEYHQSQPQIDPVTGGPDTHQGGSPLDHMTEEEKEREAAKLQELIDKLERHGIIKMVSLGQQQQQQPADISELAMDSDSSSSDAEADNG